MILILWASPNQNGLTANAKEMILQGILRAGEQAEAIQLNRCTLQAGRVCADGWGTCRKQGTCILRDDFPIIYEKLMQADGFVIVTPVYWHDMAEPLKCFLDRVRRCETKYNHKLQNKMCFLAACPGGSGRGGIQCLLKMEETMAHMGVQTVERLPVNQFNRAYMLPALRSAGEAFARSVRAVRSDTV